VKRISDTIRPPIRWPERALRMIILFVAIVDGIFLALIPLSLVVLDTPLLLGWFFGPVLLCLLPLLLFIYTGMRQPRTSLYEILAREQRSGISIEE
jgi:uncharacterized Tic20 family protein